LTSILYFCASIISSVNGMTSLMAWERAMYSALVLLRAISVCSLDVQSRGHPA
jgi:hypothetical protein